MKQPMGCFSYEGFVSKVSLVAVSSLMMNLAMINSPLSGGKFAAAQRLLLSADRWHESTPL
jgi:hypothetical protein